MLLSEGRWQGTAAQFDKEYDPTRCVCACLLWRPLPEADLHLETLVDAGELLEPDGIRRFQVRLTILIAYADGGILGAARALAAAMEVKDAK